MKDFQHDLKIVLPASCYAAKKKFHPIVKEGCLLERARLEDTQRHVS